MKLRWLQVGNEKVLQISTSSVCLTSMPPQYKDNWETIPTVEETQPSVSVKDRREFWVYRQGPHEYWQASQFKELSNNMKEVFHVTELRPNERIVTREDFNNAWKKIVLLNTGLTTIALTNKFNEFFVELGFDLLQSDLARYREALEQIEKNFINIAKCDEPQCEGCYYDAKMAAELANEALNKTKEGK